MKNIPLLLGTIIATVVLIIGVAVVFSDSSQKAAQPLDQAQLLSGAANTKGNPDAPVTIIEFSDFECPACGYHALNTLPPVLEQYSDDIFFVYRHFPLTSIHKYAQISAQFSELAAQENKFWEAHDLLFTRQEEWSKLESQDEVIAIFEGYAQELEIDKTDFSSRIQSTAIKDRVNQDLALSQQLKLTATPTFIVNGQQTPAQDLFQVVGEILSETQ